MGFVDNLLTKLKLKDDENQDYDDYDDFDEEEEKPARAADKRKNTKEPEIDYDFDDEDDSPYSNPKNSGSEKPASSYRSAQNNANKVVGTTRQSVSGFSNEICVIVPKSFDDANTIADVLLQNKAVLLNLEGVDMAASQRMIDFASGSCYTLGGHLQKVSKKMFLIVPENMSLSGDFEQVIGDMIDLNSVNMMK